MAGELVPQTLRFQGLINGKQLNVLVDTGSTHNFIQSRLAKAMGLTIHSSPKFHVMIRDGQKLECHGMCKNVKLTIQKFTFLASFYVLPI